MREARSGALLGDSVKRAELLAMLSPYQAARLECWLDGKGDKRRLPTAAATGLPPTAAAVAPGPPWKRQKRDPKPNPRYRE